MDLSEVQPILNEPALYIKNKKILVIADLHIGIESELREHGLNTASQTHTITSHLISLCQIYKPKEIILLGDVKHNIPTSTIQERRDVKNFFWDIKELGTIHIIPGNHDGNIHKLIPKEIAIHPSMGFIIENIGFVHGHRWPSEEIMQCKQIIMAHTHPTIMLTDRLEHKTFESCWIKGSFNKTKLKEKYPNSSDLQLLVIPAFSPLCGGVAANRDGITGPLRKIIDIPNSQIYLIDGTFLGKVKDIE
jgi:putative SbcD/Mre11-related phosphoesterase